MFYKIWSESTVKVVLITMIIFSSEIYNEIDVYGKMTI